MKIVETSLESAREDYPEVRNLAHCYGGMKNLYCGGPQRTINAIRTFLAFNDKDCVIGWCWAVPGKVFDSRAYILFLYVDEDYRGKGIGSLLYRAGKDYARKKHRPVYVDEYSSPLFFEKMRTKNRCDTWADSAIMSKLSSFSCLYPINRYW